MKSAVNAKNNIFFYVNFDDNKKECFPLWNSLQMKAQKMRKWKISIIIFHI